MFWDHILLHQFNRSSSLEIINMVCGTQLSDIRLDLLISLKGLIFTHNIYESYFTHILEGCELLFLLVCHSYNLLHRLTLTVLIYWRLLTIFFIVWIIFAGNATVRMNDTMNNDVVKISNRGTRAEMEVPLLSYPDFDKTGQSLLGFIYCPTKPCQGSVRGPNHKMHSI